MNVQRIELDLSKEPYQSQIVRIGQGDVSGTTIEATVYDNGTIPDLDGMTVTMEMRLPDGKSYASSGQCDVDGNVITCVVEEDKFAAVYGYTDEAYFVLQDGDVKYSTGRFRVKVERSAHDGADVPESWSDAVDELIDRGNRQLQQYESAEQGRRVAEEAREDAEDVRNNAIITDADATLDATDGTPSVTVTLDSPSALGRTIHFLFSHFGSSTAITNAQIDTIANDGIVTSTNILKGTGLTYLWGKIKAKFAEISHVHDASDITSGTLSADRIPNLSASKITSGVFGIDRIPNLSASKITSGTLGVDRIPDLPTSKIASGTLDVSRIPDLSADKITSGTLGTDRIPDLSTDKLTSGTLPIALGGTGITSNPSMLTNLGSTSADTVFKASPKPGVTGTLPVANGGTGKATHTSNSVLTGNGTGAVKDVTTASGAFYATTENGAAQFGTLPVAQGGTGATTAADAVTNIVNGQALAPASVAATGEVSAKSGTTTHKLTNKAESSAVAYVEATTAKKAHAVGDYFMLGGVLMVATTAIAAGESITTSNATAATLFGYAFENRRKIQSLMTATATHTETLGTINANASKTITVTICEDTASYEYRVLGILGIRSCAPVRGTLVVSDYYTYTNNISTGKRYIVSATFRNVTSAAVTCTEKPQIMFVRMTYLMK